MVPYFFSTQTWQPSSTLPDRRSNSKSGASRRCSEPEGSMRRWRPRRPARRGSRESRRAVPDCGEPALLEAHSRGAGDACGAGEAPSSVQPIVPGARPLSCGAAPRRACHPSLHARGDSQLVASRELERPQVLFRMAGGHADARERRRPGREARELAAGDPVPPSACSRTAKSQRPSRSCASICLTHGDHIEGMRLLAQIGMKLDVADDAELLLENVLLLAPDYHAARYEYAQALLTRHKHVRARARNGETARNRSEQPGRTAPPMRRYAPDSATTRKPCRCIVKSSPRRRTIPSCTCRSRMR